MALDTNLMYGLMAAAGIVHAGLPLLIYVVCRHIQTDFFRGPIFLILVCIACSFVVQLGLLTTLQQSTCKGVTSFNNVLIGAGVAAAITGVMMAIPAFVEPMRLMVTSTFGLEHRLLLNEEDVKKQEIILDAAKKIYGGTTTSQSVQPTQDEIGEQTRLETSLGGAFWLFFAGLYGVGAGTMFASSCNA